MKQFLASIFQDLHPFRHTNEQTLNQYQLPAAQLKGGMSNSPPLITRYIHPIHDTPKPSPTITATAARPETSWDLNSAHGDARLPVRTKPSHESFRQISGPRASKQKRAA